MYLCFGQSKIFCEDKTFDMSDAAHGNPWLASQADILRLPWRRGDLSFFLDSNLPSWHQNFSEKSVSKTGENPLCCFHLLCLLPGHWGGLSKTFLRNPKIILSLKGEPGTQTAERSEESGQRGKERGGENPQQARETRCSQLSSLTWCIFCRLEFLFVVVIRFQGATESLPHTLKLIWRLPPYLATCSQFSHIPAPHHLAKKHPTLSPPSPQLELKAAVGANPVIVQHRHASSIPWLWSFGKKAGFRFTKLPSVTKSAQRLKMNSDLCVGAEGRANTVQWQWKTLASSNWRRRRNRWRRKRIEGSRFGLKLWFYIIG